MVWVVRGPYKLFGVAGAALERELPVALLFFVDVAVFTRSGSVGSCEGELGSLVAGKESVLLPTAGVMAALAVAADGLLVGRLVAALTAADAVPCGDKVRRSPSRGLFGLATVASVAARLFVLAVEGKACGGVVKGRVLLDLLPR